MDIQDPFVTKPNTAAKLQLDAAGFVVLSPPEAKAMRDWIHANVPLAQRRRDLARNSSFVDALHLATAIGRVMSS